MSWGCLTMLIKHHIIFGHPIKPKRLVMTISCASIGPWVKGDQYVPTKTPLNTTQPVVRFLEPPVWWLLKNWAGPHVTRLLDSTE